MTSLKSCHCCGLIQQAPAASRAFCARCETALDSWLAKFGGNRPAAALSLTGLVLYVPAMLLPFLRIEQLGQVHESSLLVGVHTLFLEGHRLVGAIVLLFSVVLPLFKLGALLFLSQRRWQLGHRHRALTYRIVEQLGRWGMLDVLLVAVMVAFIKLGGLVDFGAGLGLVVFALFVLVSLCASALFDPHCLWDEQLNFAASSPASMPGKPSPDAPDKAVDSTDAKPQFPTAKTPGPPPKASWSPHWVWLLPGTALLLVLGVAWNALENRGREIEISFTDGHGIEKKDELRYHGIVVGEVENVALTDDLEGVAVAIRLTREADHLAREGSRFWIVRPQAGFTGVSGLETVVGSKYIAVQPGPADASPISEFVGLEEPPLPDLEYLGGIEVVLESQQATGLRPGLGVHYRNVRIGGIVKTGLAPDGSAVETRVYIRPEYRHLIRQKTKFWNAGGIRVTGGLTSLSVHLGTLETIVLGGIAIAVPPEPGPDAASGARFDLHEQAEDEWLAWKPSVENRLLPVPAALPTLASATLSWQHDGYVRNPEQKRTGWVMPLEGGLLGPRDLLAVPDDVIEGTLQLTIGEQSIPLTGELRAIEEQVVVRAIDEGLLEPSTATRRRMTTPEDGFLITGGNQSPLLIAAARYEPLADGGWKIEAYDAVDGSHHGGVIVATRDGAVVGCVVYDGERASVYPVVEK